MKAGEKHRTPRKATLAGRFVSVPVLMTVVTCPSCGSEVDLWTGEEETRCFACEYIIHKKQRSAH
jgi:DNA-directed RNA polymerase subunit RPC12/RpoP